MVAVLEQVQAARTTMDLVDKRVRDCLSAEPRRPDFCATDERKGREPFAATTTEQPRFVEEAAGKV
jgi:hypothetical protein